MLTAQDCSLENQSEYHFSKNGMNEKPKPKEKAKGTEARVRQGHES